MTWMNLTNTSNPTILVQYGCWPSLYIIPKQATSMSEVWVTADNGGAAASLGAVGLTIVPSDTEIGREFSKRVSVPGKTIGMALVEAKQND